MPKAPPQDFASLLNENAADGWVRSHGLRYTRATFDEVEAELEIGPQHLQAYGIVHGGVHAGIIETLASVGAALNAMQDGKSAVGLENHTSFLRAARSGKIRAIAKPVHRGRTSHVWEGSIFDAQGRLLASGRVRMQILDASAQLAGEKVSIQGGDST